MDMTTFFAYARRAPFGGRLTDGQVKGMKRLFDEWRFYGLFGLAPREYLAYTLASEFRETGGRMQPVRETLASSDAGAIKALDKAYAAGKLGQVKEPYWRKDKDGKSWYGRGRIQITHKRNYEKLGKRLGVDLVGNPDLALDPVISARITIIGMLEGLFTGKKLSHYFSASKSDPVGARRIVNGTDKAKLIAGYYQNFLDAINAAYEVSEKGERPADVAALDAQPDNVPAVQSKSLWTIIAGVFGAGGLSVARDAKDIADSGATLLGAISNPWAFGSLVFSAVAAGVLVWLIGSGRITINRSKTT
ncbi:hypothetical protein G6M84_10415 [Agrobacterium tumefaciens]|uniref:glycoside hydrolase family 19 protein n=1 Tax=Agrobacterium tumefaciens TaxID=358 RepID=UPI001572CD1E|nr:glycoside hydrolase family 19 protein [Agrobacterium tumefaciens]NTB96930.1 hypothetical protein [Agrobacterium tumefaciens]NTC44156.1 hypothetical protein [Agrobacterium tumefaciens]